MENQGISWEVFIQAKPGLAHKHVGNLRASDKNMALQNARDLYTRRQEGTCIWVVPTHQIISSVPDDEDEFFDPMDDKIYRQATDYNLPDGIEHM
jgi:ring-1,2-phenylacetyl-CoA epoxidase subunit PaaB